MYLSSFHHKFTIKYSSAKEKWGIHITIQILSYIFLQSSYVVPQTYEILPKSEKLYVLLFFHCTESITVALRNLCACSLDFCEALRLCFMWNRLFYQSPFSSLLILSFFFCLINQLPRIQTCPVFFLLHNLLPSGLTPDLKHFPSSDSEQSSSNNCVLTGLLVFHWVVVYMSTELIIFLEESCQWAQCPLLIHFIF